MTTKRVFIVSNADDEEGIPITLDLTWLNVEGNLGLSGATVAAYIGQCVLIHADRVRRHEAVSAHFRAWKARKMKAELASDPKLAAWKAELRYRDNKQYEKYTDALAELNGDITFVKGFQKALEIKALTVNAFVKSDHGAELATAATGLSSSETTKKRKVSVKPKKSSVNRDLSD